MGKTTEDIKIWLNVSLKGSPKGVFQTKKNEIKIFILKFEKQQQQQQQKQQQQKTTTTKKKKKKKKKKKQQKTKTKKKTKQTNNNNKKTTTKKQQQLFTQKLKIWCQMWCQGSKLWKTHKESLIYYQETHILLEVPSTDYSLSMGNFRGIFSLSKCWSLFLAISVCLLLEWRLSCMTVCDRVLFSLNK